MPLQLRGSTLTMMQHAISHLMLAVLCVSILRDCPTWVHVLAAWWCKSKALPLHTHICHNRGGPPGDNLGLNRSKGPTTAGALCDTESVDLSFDMLCK